MPWKSTSLEASGWLNTRGTEGEYTVPNLIEIAIRDKIASQTDDTKYICGNSSFVVNFDFDDEWNEFDTKTARFRYNGTHQDVIFQGNQCGVPVIEDTYKIQVGVYAGNLHTTTPAYVSAKKSILCGSGSPAAPSDDVYNQIMELIQGLGNPDPAAIAAAVSEYMAQNPITESDPTVPEWAKTETKPEYTAWEVGALSGKSVYYWSGSDGNDVFAILDGYSCGLIINGGDALFPDGMTFPAFVIVGSSASWNKNFSVIDNGGKFYKCVADLRYNTIKYSVVYPTAEDVGAVSTEELSEAINTALAQAKASGEFDGADGQDGSNGEDGKTPVKGTDYFTEADKQEIAEAAAELVDVPTSLPTPNKLTFTGAVSAEFDGSEAVTVEIPEGGSGGGMGTVNETTLASGTLATGTAANTYTDTGLTVGDLRQWKMFGLAIIAGQESTYWSIHFPNYTHKAFRAQRVKFRVLLEWADDSKTALRVYLNSKVTGYENADIVKAIADVSDNFDMYFCGQLALVDVADSVAVTLLHDKELTADVTWTIEGVIK